MNRLEFGLSRVMLVSAIVVAQLSAHAGDTLGVAPLGLNQTPVPIGAPYRPIPVEHPELMAGGWEAADPSGTVDQLMIHMTTVIDSSALGSLAERLASLTVSGSIRLGSGEPMRLSITARLPGPLVDPALNTVWIDKHLRLGSSVGATGAVLSDVWREVPIELDLTFDETRLEWTGTISGRGVSKPVRFSRPGTSLRAPRIAPLVGYWCAEESIGASCVRIAEGADGNVHVWRDSVPWLDGGQGRAGQGRYGGALRVIGPPALDTINFIYGQGTPKTSYFKGRLSADGTRLEGQLTWPFAGPAYAPRPLTFVKSDTGAWPASSRRP